ncbi:MAG: DNA-directed RNA polymerase subunit alpha C-terminal domain-containing protein [Chloroflexota bacterium]
MGQIPGLTERALNALREAGIQTVGDVYGRLQQGGDDALLSITGVGQKALIDLKKFLRSQEVME